MRICRLSAHALSFFGAVQMKRVCRDSNDGFLWGEQDREHCRQIDCDRHVDAISVEMFRRENWIVVIYAGPCISYCIYHRGH